VIAHNRFYRSPEKHPGDRVLLVQVGNIDIQIMYKTSIAGLAIPACSGPFRQVHVPSRSLDIESM